MKSDGSFASGMRDDGTTTAGNLTRKTSQPNRHNLNSEGTGMRKRQTIKPAAVLALAVIVTVTIALGLMKGGGEDAVESHDGMAANQADMTTEDIEVHGDWTIDVLGPGGRVVSHSEFDNALHDEGRVLLSILSRELTIGSWNVSLAGSFVGDGTNPCVDTSGARQACHTREADSGGAGSQIFKTLTVTQSGSTGANLKLSGSVVAQTNGEVSHVNAGIMGCNPNIETDTEKCAGGSAAYLPTSVTRTEIKDANGQPAPVLVTEGQQILVNVVISFE